MKNSVLAAVALSVGLSAGGLSATARPDYRWRGGPDNPDWDAADHYDGRWHHGERRLTRADYVYRGRDGRWYCKRPDGTTGLVVGGLTGAAIGQAIGGDTVAALLGAAGGALLGQRIDRGEVRCR
jgi:hypothetical protein